MAANNAINQPIFQAQLVPSNGGLFYSTATEAAILAGTATASQVLLSGSSTTPAWSTATYPATTTINQILYSSSANVIAGLATANNGVLITGAGGIPSIGSTLPTAVQTNITELGTITVGVWNGTIIGPTYGGTGVNNGSSTITIGGNFTMSGAYTFTGTLTGNTSVTFPTSGTLATVGTAYNIVDQTSGTAAIAVNTFYVTDNGASLVTYTLPVTAILGSIVKIVGKSSGGWKIAQNASQLIEFGTVVTTTGTGGSLASTNLNDCIEIMCTTANTTWTVMNVQGNITYV